MSTAASQRLTSRPRSAAGILASLLFFSPQFIWAEIVIDDFTTPAAVTQISTGFAQHPAITEHVGALDARREIKVTASQTIPDIWSFDSGASSTSALSARFFGHTPTSTNSAVVTFPVTYTFAPRDLTEQGVNDALFFDFRSHEGNVHPTFFRAFITTPAPSGMSTDIFAAYATNFAFSEDPFTTIIPFSSFTFRDGAPGTPDLSKVNLIGFDFFFLYPSETVQWSFELDRIRIGSVITPEPNSEWLIVIGVFMLLPFRLVRTKSLIESKDSLYGE